MTTAAEIFSKLGLDPAPKDYLTYLAQWAKISAAAKLLSETEMAMRKSIVASTFPNAKEGVNTHALPDGRKVKATCKVSRSLDESQIGLVRSEYDLLNDRPVVFDELLKTKYDLVLSAYRKLEPKENEQPSAAFLTVSRMVTVKPSAPTLEIKE